MKNVANNELPKIAIIGGGAAGFMAAIRAKEVNRHASICIYESTGKVLAKVALTGGGRCNLTNTFAQVSDMKQVYPRGGRLMERLFHQFDNRDVMNWFESHGVQLLVQDDERVFPLSQSSQSVIDCLLGEAYRRGVEICLRHALNGIQVCGDKLRLSFDGGEAVEADCVILATGGLSQGKLYKVLSQLGHEMKEPVPSLFTFNVRNDDLRGLMGTDVRDVAIHIEGTKYNSVGAMLITHWGLSGPAVLKLSSQAAPWMKAHDYRFQLYINWMGNANATAVGASINELLLDNKKSLVKNVKPSHLSSRLWEYLLVRAGLDVDKRCDELGKKGLNKLVEVLIHDIYAVDGKSRWRDEFVTCGGVSLAAIHPNTMESRAVDGLFFAGEMLDIDGITGGFNLQAAWTTGYVAGENAVLGRKQGKGLPNNP